MNLVFYPTIHSAKRGQITEKTSKLMTCRGLDIKPIATKRLSQSCILYARIGKTKPKQGHCHPGARSQVASPPAELSMRIPILNDDRPLRAPRPDLSTPLSGRRLTTSSVVAYIHPTNICDIPQLSIEVRHELEASIFTDEPCHPVFHLCLRYS